MLRLRFNGEMARYHQWACLARGAIVTEACVFWGDRSRCEVSIRVTAVDFCCDLPARLLF